jgi:CRISPR system Cascade subunit CasD
MQFLVFQLQAAMASWGDVAVGETRGSRDAPGTSALVGLLGAALGLRRDDEAAHAALCDGYGFAVGVVDSGHLLRDYHTAQVPGRSTLKGRPHRSRRDELAMPRHELNTILSTRDYRQGGAWAVALQPRASAPHGLEHLQRSLREPRFVLYLGRKCCPPAAPLAPEVLDADSAHAALTAYLAAAEPPGGLHSMAWGEGVAAGVEPHLSVPRKDRIIRRGGWLFGDRTEHLALLTGDSPGDMTATE